MHVRKLFPVLVLMALLPVVPLRSAQDDQKEPPKLLGEIESTQLGEEPYSEWYRDAYVDYAPNPAVLEELRAAEWDGVTITAFFGTWCGDSQREIPRLVKLLDVLEFPEERLTLVAVDHIDEATKQSPGGEEKGMEVYKVPTIVVSRDGGEVTRYVEHAVLSLERDLLAILSGELYEHSYSTYPTVRRWFDDGLLGDANINPRGLAIEVRHEIQSERELLAAGRVLLSRGDTAEAVMLYRVNTVLFPQSAMSFYRLAEGYRELGEMEKAREMAEMALRLNSEPGRVSDLVKLIDSTGASEDEDDTDE
jgi:thiol-disulfide isomerase/thioredoxin